VVDEAGRLHAGQPPHYNLSEEELRFLLADMRARVEAIEFELERRSFEPDKIVLEFIGNRFHERVRDSYSQSQEN